MVNKKKRLETHDRIRKTAATKKPVRTMHYYLYNQIYDAQYYELMARYALHLSPDLFSAKTVGVRTVDKKDVLKIPTRPLLLMSRFSMSRKLNKNKVPRGRGRPPKVKSPKRDMPGDKIVAVETRIDKEQIKEVFDALCKSPQQMRIPEKVVEYPSQHVIAIKNEPNLISMVGSADYNNQDRIEPLSAENKKHIKTTPGVQEGRGIYRKNRTKVAPDAPPDNISAQYHVLVTNAELEKRRADGDNEIKILGIERVESEDIIEKAKFSSIITQGAMTPISKHQNPDIKITSYDKDGNIIKEYADSESQVYDELMGGLDDDIAELMSEEIPMHVDTDTRVPCRDGEAVARWDGMRNEVSKETPVNNIDNIVITNLNEKSLVTTTNAENPKDRSYYVSQPPSERTKNQDNFIYHTVEDNTLFHFTIDHASEADGAVDDEQLWNACRMVLSKEVKPHEEEVLLFQPDSRLGEKECGNGVHCVVYEKFVHFSPSDRCILKEWQSAKEIEKFFKNKMIHKNAKQGYCFLCYRDVATSVYFYLLGNMRKIKRDVIISPFHDVANVAGGYSRNAMLFPGNMYRGIDFPLLAFCIKEYEPVSKIVNGRELKGVRPLYPRADYDRRLNFRMGED